MQAKDILYLKLRYSFESSTGSSYMEGFDCYTQYAIDVYGCDSADIDEDTKEVLIGKARVSLFYLGYLINNGLLLEDLLSNSSSDACGYVGDFIMDRKTGELKPEFDELLAENGNFNVLYINDIVLFPEYRGYGYGKFIIKDILCRFDGTVGLVLAIVYPLQLDTSSMQPAMQYHRMDQDLEYSSFKLYGYFLDLGFEQVERTNYFYINPCKVNEKLNAIDLEQLFDEEYYGNILKQ
ncbi:hypothetical protein [Dysgonomonas termitidis]|uniref:N-acetyltransferase domain-containing protein n=1 Tax=Dysgonomonas termitidis TaxID=1516126 RepID=A0ABV9KYX8_9BACT